jgi:hypothetical protein
LDEEKTFFMEDPFLVGYYLQMEKFKALPLDESTSSREVAAQAMMLGLLLEKIQSRHCCTDSDRELSGLVSGARAKIEEFLALFA